MTTESLLAGGLLGIGFLLGVVIYELNLLHNALKQLVELQQVWYED